MPAACRVIWAGMGLIAVLIGVLRLCTHSCRRKGLPNSCGPLLSAVGWRVSHDSEALSGAG